MIGTAVDGLAEGLSLEDGDVDAEGDTDGLSDDDWLASGTSSSTQDTSIVSETAWEVLKYTLRLL